MLGSKIRLFLMDRPLFNAKYNPQPSESGVTNEVGEFIEEQGFDDPDELEDLMKTIYADRQVSEGKLGSKPAVGEWI